MYASMSSVEEDGFSSRCCAEIWRGTCACLRRTNSVAFLVSSLAMSRCDGCCAEIFDWSVSARCTYGMLRRSGSWCHPCIPPVARQQPCFSSLKLQFGLFTSSIPCMYSCLRRIRVVLCGLIRASAICTTCLAGRWVGRCRLTTAFLRCLQLLCCTGGCMSRVWHSIGLDGSIFSS